MTLTRTVRTSELITPIADIMLGEVWWGWRMQQRTLDRVMDLGVDNPNP
jgi:hypothetical protein